MTRSASLTRHRRTLVATVAVLGLAAVGAQQASATTVPDAPSSAATVVAGMVLEPTNLDIIHTAGAALDQVLLDNVYETLVAAAPSGEISPGVANLAISDDALTYTLTLENGVTFSDGSPLTAADVVWSLDQMRGEGANPSGELTAIGSVEATDDATVVVTLTQPDNDLAFNLSRRAGAVLKEGAADLETTALGTGPFTLEEWNQGSSITLARDDAYYGTLPKVGEVVFQYFTDPNAAVAALQDGDADLLTGVNTDLVGQFTDNPDYVVSTGPTNGEFTLGYNNQDEALSDIRVRQALTQAVDKQGVLDLYNGYGTIIGGPVPPSDPWYEDLSDINAYDPESAQALLDEAGYGDGLDLTFVVPDFYPASVSDYVTSQLAAVGVTVDVQPVAFGAWIEQVYTNHDYDLTAVIHVEPRDIYNYGNPDYYWQYDSPEVQDLLNQAKSSADPSEANDLLQQAARQIAEDAPVNWLILIDDVIVSRAGVEGYPTFDANSRFDAAGLVVTD